jgi:hypothetical protein
MGQVPRGLRAEAAGKQLGAVSVRVGTLRDLDKRRKVTVADDLPATQRGAPTWITVRRRLRSGHA